jgi:hypothetical protein
MLLDHSDLSRMLYIGLEFLPRWWTYHQSGTMGRVLENQSQALTLVASLRLLHRHRHQSSISVSASNGKQSPSPTNRSAKCCIIFYKGVSFECLSYCGRGKGMPNGWSFNWESMATRERGKPGDMSYRELACCLRAICVLAVSSRC